MRVLITGASGLLGTRLCEIAVNKNHEVYSAYSQHTPANGEPMKLQVFDGEAVKRVFRAAEPDAVIHAAALTDVDRCEREHDLADRVNFKGTANVAESCREHGSFLVYVSTDYVFDGKKGMYTESDPPAPINHYGVTKLRGEEVVRQLAVEHCIVRSSVVYGSTPTSGKINFALWLLEKLQKKEKVDVAANQWNSPTLNTTLAEMIVEVFERKITGVLHLAGATRISRYEFAMQLAETFSLSPSCIVSVLSEDLPWAAKRPKDSSLCVEKANRTLGTKPMHLNEALSRMKKELFLGR